MGKYLRGRIWYIDYYANGRRMREKVGTSAKLADIVLQKRKVQIAEGRFLDVKKVYKVKFEDFADEYLEVHCKSNNKAWRKSDQPNLGSLKKYFSGRYLHEITPEDIERYRTERIKKVTKSTVNRILNCLSSMYNRAIEWGKAEYNPVSKVKLYRVPEKRIRYLEREEIEKLLSHCCEHLRPIVIVALHTGMRKSEILCLKWQDIDIKRNIIHLLDTKNGEKAEIPMNEIVQKTIIGVFKNPESQYVFCNNKNKPYGNVRKSFNTACRNAEIIDFRSQLVRGMYSVHVKKAGVAGRILDQTREIALSENYVETEMKLKKPPQGRLYVSDEVQPVGPTAPLQRMDIGYLKWESHMEKAHYDTDLKAVEATKKLYENGVSVNNIMRAFSMGSFGVEKNRKLVPTRWSITAVDDIISKDLANKIKDYPQVNQFEVYESDYLGNRFEVVLVPDAWSYEAYEAWYPQTLWNPSSDHVAIVTDWEGYHGRKKYASMGGCYYSGRLAALEHLERMRRQAKVFIFREAYPDYILPVGVWQVRENVRNAMRGEPLKFDSLGDALQRVMGRLSIGVDHWVASGPLLRNTLTQRKITEFM